MACVGNRFRRKWAVQRGRLDRNPVDQIVRPKRKDRPPRVPRWSVVENLASNGLDLRAKAIIALLAWGGLRRAEVAALDVGDFDPAFGLGRVRGKGGHEEAVALPDRACQIIAAYLAANRAGVEADTPMFVTSYLSWRRGICALSRSTSATSTSRRPRSTPGSRSRR
jgi:site-specific recombinase XerC